MFFPTPPVQIEERTTLPVNKYDIDTRNEQDWDNSTNNNNNTKNNNRMATNQHKIGKGPYNPLVQAFL